VHSPGQSRASDREVVDLPVGPDPAQPSPVASPKETRVKSIISCPARTAETNMIVPAHSSPGARSHYIRKVIATGIAQPEPGDSCASELEYGRI